LCKNEDHIIDAYCELTFKLSEETFRPIFFKFYEWATINEPPKDRLITFYRTTYKLSNKLKNLFILFSTHFIQNAAGILDTLNVSKTGKLIHHIKRLAKQQSNKNITFNFKHFFFQDENFFLNKKERTKYVYANEKLRLLLFSIVDTMANLFLHDSDKFMTTNDRFNLIMQPLVDQVSESIRFGKICAIFFHFHLLLFRFRLKMKFNSIITKHTSTSTWFHVSRTLLYCARMMSHCAKSLTIKSCSKRNTVRPK
jgi:hypothetical protein